MNWHFPRMHMIFFYGGGMRFHTSMSASKTFIHKNVIYIFIACNQWTETYSLFSLAINHPCRRQTWHLFSSISNDPYCFFWIPQGPFVGGGTRSQRNLQPHTRFGSPAAGHLPEEARCHSGHWRRCTEGRTGVSLPVPQRKVELHPAEVWRDHLYTGCACW